MYGREGVKRLEEKTLLSSKGGKMKEWASSVQLFNGKNILDTILLQGHNILNIGNR